MMKSILEKFAGTLWAVLAIAVVAVSCDSSSTPDNFAPDPDGGSGKLLEVSPRVVTVPVAGQTVRLHATVRDSRGRAVEGARIDWMSRDPDVAMVDAGGLVETIARGDVVVRASYGSVTDSARITIANGPPAGEIEQIRITPYAPTLTSVGETLQLNVVGVSSDGGSVQGLTASWTALDSVVATVNATGLVRGVEQGVARVTARHGRRADTAYVAVAPRARPASVQITPQADTIAVIGESVRLHAVAYDRKHRPIERASIGWETLDRSIASVTRSGKVSARSRGVARIVAISGGAADTATVSVHPLPVAKSIEITPSADTIPTVGGSVTLAVKVVGIGGQQLSAQNVTWRSLDATAVMTSAGKVTAVSKGVARVTAMYGALADTAVIVIAPVAATAQPHAVVITPGADTIPNVGDVLWLKAIVVDANGAPIAGATMQGFDSLDPAVAKAGDAGKVTALAAGTARIIAKAGTLRDTALITIAPPPPPAVPTMLEISPRQDTMEVGSTLDLQASITDSNGETMTVSSVDWKALDHDVVDINASGAPTTSANGERRGVGRIEARHGALSDTAWIWVDDADAAAPAVPAALEISAPVDTLTTAGGTIQLSARLLDQSGNPVAAAGLFWLSLDPGIATVNGTGLVTAVSQGTSRIVAQSGALLDTMRIVVALAPVAAPAAASIALTPRADTIPTVGGSVQLAAAVRDATGAVLSGASVSWSSLDPSIAAVSAGGLVSGLASGTARIRAASASFADTATVWVAPKPQGTQPPVTGKTIAVDIVRMDGRTGNALVSNAIPLAPGMMYPGDGARLHVLVNGQDQSVYVEELKGLFPNGSLRSVLVQFRYDVGSANIPAQVVIGSARTTPSPAKWDPMFTMQSPVPQAAALPTDPNYLMSTGIVRPTVGIAEGDAFEPLYDQRFHAAGDPKWNLFEREYTTQSVDYVVYRNYYDRGLINFAYWVRSGDPEYFRRGTMYAVAYRERYHRPNNYKVQPHQVMIEGEALVYRLLGDEESRRAVQANAEFFRDAWLSKLADETYQWTEPRPQARAIEAFIAARDEDVAGDWAKALHTALDTFLPQQDPDGAFRYPNTCMGSSNFMSGLFNDALIRYWEEFEHDPRIPVVMAKNLEWMWNNQWSASGGGFAYHEKACSTGSATPAPDLNLLIVNGFGWLYQQTRDPKWRQRGDEVFRQGIKLSWLGLPGQADKQFNQQYRSAFGYLNYRR